MAKHVHHHPPAPPPPPPAPAAAPAPKPESVLESAIKLVGVAVLVVGAITLAAPWLRGAERRPPPPPGWTCWTIETSGGSHHACSPARGWHIEHWPGAGEVSVPDYAPGRYRYVVRE